MYDPISTRPLPKGSAIIRDQIIRLSSQQARKAGLFDIRRIEYQDPQSAKIYVFLSNQLHWSAQTVADIYKSRWEVELFLKWIKQNLKIKTVLGHTINAVASQVFVARGDTGELFGVRLQQPVPVHRKGPSARRLWRNQSKGTAPYLR